MMKAIVTPMVGGGDGDSETYYHDGKCTPTIMLESMVADDGGDGYGDRYGHRDVDDGDGDGDDNGNSHS